MIVIRSARARRILRYLIPFFIIPALIAAGVFLLHALRPHRAADGAVRADPVCHRL